MTLEVVICEKPSLECFCEELESRGISNFVSLEHCISKPKNSVVVCKIVKQVVSEPLDANKLTFVAKEVLPDKSYGQHFFAFIHGHLVKPLQKFKPNLGDRMALFEPKCKVINKDTTKGKWSLMYSAKIGEEKGDRIWCARKEKVCISSPPEHSKQTTSILVQNTSKEKNSVEENETKEKSIFEDTCKITSSKFTSPQQDLKKNPSPPSKKSKTVETMSNKPQDIEQETKTNREQNLTNINQNEKKLQRNGDLSNKKPLQVTNPNYSYKTLVEIKSNALGGDLNRVNAFCVVHHITKPLTTTPSGKFTLIIEAVDQTMEDDSTLTVHFFTVEDTILKQITQGDILRLHRIKMELFRNDADGRIFNSTDITIFKPNTPDFITLAKHTVVTDSEKMKATELKTWHKQKMASLFSDVVHLSEITDRGKYKLFCKIVEEPYEHLEGLTIKVTDGTVIQHLCPAFPLDEGNQPLVTKLNIWMFEKPPKVIKSHDYILFKSVTVVKTNVLTLNIYDDIFKSFASFDKCTEQSLEIERRIAENNKKADEQLLGMSEVVNGRNLPGENTNIITSNQSKETQSNMPRRELRKRPSSKEKITDSTSGIKSSVLSSNKDSLKSNNLQPVVWLKKITNICEKQSVNVDSNTEKRSPNQNVTEDLEYASTVVNMSYQQSVLMEDGNKAKKPRLEGEEIIPVAELSPERKVASWLEHHDTNDPKAETDQELHLSSVKRLILQEEDFSSLIKSPIANIMGFVSEILPNPGENECNLVSGFCKRGCQNIFPFSTIEWKKEDDVTAPICPSCKKLEKVNELALIFMFELEIFDEDGRYATILICQQQAEIFLNCTVKEYLSNKNIRDTYTSFLMQLTGKIESRNIRPKLELNIAEVKNVLCLVETRLKLPPIL